jgi:sirohydrochlorin cobaltochelatase
MNDRAAVLLCGHGSRDPEAIGEFAAVAAKLRRRRGGCDVATSHLEFARPRVGEALAALTAAGARRIVAVPAMLHAASHVKRDLPREIAAFAAANPTVSVRLCRDLADEAKLRDAAAARIAAAAPHDRGDVLLLVVGRGANDAGANASVAELARGLGEAMGFGGAQAAFSGIAEPRIDAALDRAAQLRFRRIVVFPYFLFAGVLVKRIYAATNAAAARFPDRDFAKAEYLRDHPAVIDALLDRIAEAEAAAAAPTVA